VVTPDNDFYSGFLVVYLMATSLHSLHVNGRTLRDIIARQQHVTGCAMMSNVLQWNVKRTTEINAVIVCTHITETNAY